MWNTNGQLVCHKMATYTEHFFVGSDLLFSRECYWVNTNLGRPSYLASAAMFCPMCGEIWARRFCSPSPQGWHAEHVLCHKCGGGSLVLNDVELGHMLDGYYDEHFPREWLEWEFLTELRRH